MIRQALRTQLALCLPFVMNDMNNLHKHTDINILIYHLRGLDCLSF